MGHFWFCLGDNFFFIPFDLSEYEMTNFWFWVQEKVVQYPHLLPYLVLTWRWI